MFYYDELQYYRKTKHSFLSIDIKTVICFIKIKDLERIRLPSTKFFTPKLKNYKRKDLISNPQKRNTEHWPSVKTNVV